MQKYYQGLLGRQIARNDVFYQHFLHNFSHLHTYILASKACPASRPALDPVSDLVIVVWEGASKMPDFACFLLFYKHFPSFSVKNPAGLRPAGRLAGRPPAGRILANYLLTAAV